MLVVTVNLQSGVEDFDSVLCGGRLVRFRPNACLVATVTQDLDDLVKNDRDWEARGVVVVGRHAAVAKGGGTHQYFRRSLRIQSDILQRRECCGRAALTVLAASSVIGFFICRDEHPSEPSITRNG